MWLRGPSLSDVPAYQKHFADYEVIRHLAATVPWPYPEDGVEQWLRNVVLPAQGNDRWTWGLFQKHTPDECIGSIGLWREGKPEHRGFWLGRAYWGHGLMTEAATAVTTHAFAALGFDKLIFSNAVGNQRSRRIKEKCGARLLGTAPARFVDPTVVEHELWETTKADWFAR